MEDLSRFITPPDELDEILAQLPDVDEDETIQDAAPRTLYVRRDVLNADDLRAWAKSVGFETVVDGMHVTIAFSKTPVDWSKITEATWSGDEDGNLRVKPGGMRLVEKLGEATTLLFACSELVWRNMDMRNNAGCSWDYEDYQPHITISRKGGPTDVEPYRGEILLGPEIFEEINEDWKSTVQEDSNPNHEPAGSSKGGQFARKLGGITAHAGPRHGEEHPLFGGGVHKVVDLNLTRGLKDPKPFGKIESLINQEQDFDVPGGKIATSRGEVVRYKLTTPEEPVPSKHQTLKKALEHAERLRLERNERIRKKKLQGDTADSDEEEDQEPSI